MVTLRMAGAILSITSAWMCGCGSSTPVPVKADAVAAAKVDNRVKEGDLTRVTLTPEAEKRLGIEIATVAEQTASNQLRIAGDILAIPGKALIVGASCEMSNTASGVTRTSVAPWPGTQARPTSVACAASAGSVRSSRAVMVFMTAD